MNRIVECVPNFSEGKNKETIKAITSIIERTGAQILDVDMNPNANRTVVTFAGAPDHVEEAAFQAIRIATDLIDMTAHKGEHPRIGATDVCPFVPISGVTMAECVQMARRLGERVGRELGIPVYLYGEAATTPQRRNLPDIRKGEYEGLPEKLKDPEWKPDFGPAIFVPKSGATIVGAREVLIAYNINLNTRDKTAASRIAVKIREAGGIARDPYGEPLKDANGQNLRIPGLLRDIRAVGWVIEEYGIAQVSINVVNYRRTPLHLIYEEAKRLAADLGVSVTGSEVVGLVPLEALLMAGRFYLERQGLSPAAPERELVHIAVRSLGLSDVKYFNPSEKIIEYRLRDGRKTYADATLRDFLDDVSVERPVPGGGAVAAYAAALASALAAMVANITVRMPGKPLAARPPKANGLVALAQEAQSLKERLLELVTEDCNAFEAVLAARKLPAGSQEREEAELAALRRAAGVPAEVVTISRKVLDIAIKVAAEGNPNCLSDAGVAIAMACAATEGAALNVLINLPELSHRDPAFVENLRAQVSTNLESARALAASQLAMVHSRLC